MWVYMCGWVCDGEVGLGDDVWGSEPGDAGATIHTHIYIHTYLHTYTYIYIQTINKMNTIDARTGDGEEEDDEKPDEAGQVRADAELVLAGEDGGGDDLPCCWCLLRGKGKRGG